jgi:hypothetical protein
MTEAREGDVCWPTLRSKLLPVTIIRLSFWAWPRFHPLRNWYHGRWWTLEIGPLLIMGGACEFCDIKDRP